MTEHYVTPNGSGGKRIVVLDIETISTDPNEPEGAKGNGVAAANRQGLAPAAPGEKSQIVIAGMLIDDGRELRATPAMNKDERRVLQQFWATVRPDDTIVGHNVREFDLARIKQRSWILGVEPSFDVSMAKYRENQVYDVMDMWTNWGRPEGASLENIARALGVGQKSGHGSQVGALWSEGRYRELLDYCMQDVHLTYLCYCRMKFRQPLPFEMPQPVRRDQDLETQLRASIAEAGRLREPVPARPAPAYVNQDTSGRYAFKSDGRGGLISTMSEPSSPPAEARPVVGFAAAAPAPTPVAQTPQNGRSGRSRSKRVFFAVSGGSLRLNGATPVIKAELKALGARPTGEVSEGTFAWELAESRFNDVAGLCARAGLTLVAAQAPAA